MAGAVKELNPSMTEADLAHMILKGTGKPLYYRDLIDRILAIKPIRGRDLGHVMAFVHSEINFDGRFVHMGQGVWGLREWFPERRVKLGNSGEEEEVEE